MTSIRRELGLKILVGSVVLTSVSGAALYGLVCKSLSRQFDVALLATSQALVTLVMVGPDGEIELEFADEFMPRFESTHDPDYFQIWLSDGRVLERSNVLGSRDLPKRWGVIDEPLFWDLRLPDGREGRAVGVQFDPQLLVDPDDVLGEGEKGGNFAHDLPKSSEPSVQGGQVMLVVARSRHDLDAVLRTLVLSILAVALLVPLATFVFVWFFLAKVLDPLNRIARQTSEIEADNLAYRFCTADLPQELAPVASRLNELLARLEGAFERERRFTAHASHELRTPIAELRALAEVRLAAYGRANEPSGDKDHLEDTLDIAIHMERLVTTLLSLVRYEAGVEESVVEEIDVDSLWQEVWLQHQAAAASRNISLESTLSEVHIRSDRSLLFAILSNVLSNAVAYTPRSGIIHCEIVSGKNGFRVTVANTNRSLELDDLPFIFEPFWRKNEARSPSDHSGLGLSLVQSYARLLGLICVADLPSPDRFVITIRSRVCDS